MSWRSAIACLVVLAALVVVAYDRLKPTSSGPGGKASGVVTRVVDGDTVHVQLGGDDEYVRYIGVAAPETVNPGTPVQCFGKAAGAYNHRVVEGQPVRLRFDADRLDKYGLLLA